MSENTNEMDNGFARYYRSLYPNTYNEKEFKIATKAYQAGLAHKKNESVAEALEKAVKLCDRYIVQETADGNPTPIKLIQDEIRALIKESP